MVGKECYDERGRTCLYRESGAVPQSWSGGKGQSPLKLNALEGLSLTLCVLQNILYLAFYGHQK